jgi:hypothetical protein
MSIIAGWSRAPRSIIDTTAPSSTSAPAQPGNLLDQLKKMEDQRGASGSAPSPAPAPAAPAPEPPK